MSQQYPTNEGFRAVLRDPAVLLAELVWRAGFGFAAAVLIFIAVRELLLTVTISPADELLLASMQPFLVAEVWSHILRQALPLLARITSILLPALSLMWIAAATVGRTVTIQRMLDYFRERYGLSATAGGVRWGALVVLHFFRASLLLAVFLGYIGSALVASRFVELDSSPPRLDLALVVFVLLFAIVVIVAAAINWVLALAPIFVIRDHCGTWDSLADAIRLFRARGSQLTAAATWNGFLRFAAACLASFAGLVPLMLSGSVPGWAIWSVVALISILYFLVADWLLLARLGAYVSVAEQARSADAQIAS